MGDKYPMRFYWNTKDHNYMLYYSIDLETLYQNLQVKSDDNILYLGGRIDDDNLYPEGYTKYLRHKIKELNPKKIICHTHWYAWKYFQKGILDESDKIDMIFSHYDYVKTNNFQPLDYKKYDKEHRVYIRKLLEKNPNLIYGFYINNARPSPPPRVPLHIEWFDVSGYDYINNVKYFTFTRGYSPTDLLDKDIGHGSSERNSTDGFAMIINLLKFGFTRLHIAGFSAFGSNEDQSHFSKYNLKDSRFRNKTYFDIITSEDQKAEADILKYWADNKIIYNLEDHNKLKYWLGDSNEQN